MDSSQRPASPAGEAAHHPALLSGLVAASAALVTQPHSSEIGALVVDHAARLLDAPDARLLLLDTDPRWLVLRHAVGSAVQRTGIRQPSTSGLLGQVVQHGTALHTPVVTDPDWAGDTPLGAGLAVPVRVTAGAVLGVLAVARAPGQPAFTAPEQMALQVLADLAAVRIGAAHEMATVRGRAQELAALDPAWRPPVEQAGDFVMITRHSRLIDVDEAACRILGYSRAELLQRGIVDLIPLPPGVDPAQALIPLRERVFQGQPVTFDATLRRRDGGLIPVRVHLEALSTTEGPVVRGVVRDLTLDKQLDVQAMRVEKMYLLSEIGSGLAHHLNTPLAVVLGNTELLLEGEPTAEQRALLESIRDATRRISTTVQHIHRFARPPFAGVWTTVDVNRIVVEAVEAARHTLRPEGSGSVRWCLETRAVSTVYGNPIELREALNDLLTNAVQALPRGGTVVVGTAEDSDRVILSVADNGVGMSEEVRIRCTDPFFTTRRPAGNGLGLTRVYDTVLRHGGELEIESQEGAGTRVAMRLPIATDS